MNTVEKTSKRGGGYFSGLPSACRHSSTEISPASFCLTVHCLIFARDFVEIFVSRVLKKCTKVRQLTIPIATTIVSSFLDYKSSRIFSNVERVVEECMTGECDVTEARNKEFSMLIG
jgi:hypothetical protein